MYLSDEPVFVADPNSEDEPEPAYKPLLLAPLIYLTGADGTPPDFPISDPTNPFPVDN